jgi:hypothetical protein
MVDEDFDFLGSDDLIEEKTNQESRKARTNVHAARLLPRLFNWQESLIAL